MDMKKELAFLAAMVLVVSLSAIVLAAPDPSSATLTNGPSSRGTNPYIVNRTAAAGNTTSLNLEQTRITDVLQGFFGNVSGQVVLENAAGNNFYDWSYTNVSGEVYATRTQITDWSSVNCSNSTHWEDEETELEIGTSQVDGVNETYNETSHPDFSVGNLLMTGCR